VTKVTVGEPRFTGCELWRPFRQIRQRERFSIVATTKQLAGSGPPFCQWRWKKCRGYVERRTVAGRNGAATSSAGRLLEEMPRLRRAPDRCWKKRRGYIESRIISQISAQLLDAISLGILKPEENDQSNGNECRHEADFARLTSPVTLLALHLAGCQHSVSDCS
jgi:hypothetical protein